MRSAVAIALGASLALSGCADMLGLDGLTFERRVDEVRLDPNTTGGSDGAGGAFGSGGLTVGEPAPGAGGLDVGGPVPTLPRHPLALDPDVILVASPSLPKYRVYEPGSGKIVTHEMALASPDSRDWGVMIGEPSQWKPGFSHVVEIPTEGGGSLLLGYEAESGLVDIVEDLDEPVLEGEPSAGTPGWTQMFAFPYEERWLLFVYSADTGHFRLGPAEPGTADGKTIAMGDWEPGWTSVTPFRHGGEAGLLKFDAATGEVQFDRLLALGEGTELAAEGSVEGDVSHLVAFESEGKQWVALYSRSSGAVSTGSFGDAPTLQFTEESSNFWREGIDGLQRLDVRNVPNALTSSRETGVVDLISLAPLESSNPVVIR